MPLEVRKLSLHGDPGKGSLEELLHLPGELGDGNDSDVVGHVRTEDRGSESVEGTESNVHNIAKHAEKNTMGEENSSVLRSSELLPILCAKRA